MSEPVNLEMLRDDAVARIVLARPPANILDTAAVDTIRGLLGELRQRRGTKLVVFDHEGRHFSFGASVPEHLPGSVDRMLPTFHRLFRDLEDCGLPTAAVVRGQCLGGAAELALWCGTVHASSTARLGFPEVKLAVFPPVAAVALRLRVSAARATRLVTTGEVVDAATARDIGLVDLVDEDPLASMLRWYDEALAPLSPAALRFAWRASRGLWRHAVDTDLPEAERLYLQELMAHPDAVEGLTAFIEKRSPTWSQA
jgi:cyclohexa-1,5-dienecarbonyl-CoA hydratase